MSTVQKVYDDSKISFVAAQTDKFVGSHKRLIDPAVKCTKEQAKEHDNVSEMVSTTVALPIKIISHQLLRQNVMETSISIVSVQDDSMNSHKLLHYKQSIYKRIVKIVIYPIS